MYTITPLFPNRVAANTLRRTKFDILTSRTTREHKVKSDQTFPHFVTKLILYFSGRCQYSMFRFPNAPPLFRNLPLIFAFRTRQQSALHITFRISNLNNISRQKFFLNKRVMQK